MRKKAWLQKVLTSMLLCLLVSGAFADVPISYDNARAAMQRKDWETANYEWRHILELDPHNLEATLGLAESLFNTGFYQESTDLLEAIPPQQRSILVDIALARTYAATKNYVKSASSYLTILGKKPFLASASQELEAVQTHLQPQDRKIVTNKLDTIAKAAKARGDSALKASNYTDAATYYEIVATHFHTVGLVNDYGLALLLAGQYQKAHDQFALLKTKGKLRFSQVHSNAAIASLSIGNYAEAKQEIAEAINAATNNARLKAQLYNNLGYIMEMSSKRQDAKFAYQHAISLDPAMRTAQLNLAFVQQEDREYNDAITNYEEILKKNPQNPEVWNRLGFVYELQYKTKPAMRAYQRAMEVDPKYKDSYYNLSTLYKKMGKVKEANETLRQLAEMNYVDLEAKVGNKPKSSSIKNNPLKYVVLFPSNPTVIASIQ
jgi:tetratricopeptide (TPR) repeat protein